MDKHSKDTDGGNLPSGAFYSKSQDNDSFLHDKLHSLVRDLIRNEIDLQFAKKELESAYIREILTINDGNIGISAKKLGIHRNTLSKRLKDLRIKSSKY